MVEKLRTSTIYFVDDVVGRGDAGSPGSDGPSPYLRRGVPQDRVAHDQSSSTICCNGWMSRHALRRPADPFLPTPYADPPTRFCPPADPFLPVDIVAFVH